MPSRTASRPFSPPNHKKSSRKRVCFCSRKTAVFLPRAYSALDRYRPRTWVTEWTEQMGDTFTADLAVRVHPGGCTHDVRSCPSATRRSRLRGSCGNGVDT